MNYGTIIQATGIKTGVGITKNRKYFYIHITCIAVRRALSLIRGQREDYVHHDHDSSVFTVTDMVTDNVMYNDKVVSKLSHKATVP